ncbi:hypothetical protein F0U61_25440 [Archangium violaceum]|uniref:hypothetical protein n=1 Tax=Archangium violaceum TaxID=83451 RepID=UPI002B3147C2|nr:hypothetical protein F0U61_25440 [Archangium violaceum]
MRSSPLPEASRQNPGTRPSMPPPRLAPVPWGSILGVLFVTALASLLLPATLVGNVRKFVGSADEPVLWTGWGAILVSAGLSLANFLALLLAVAVGRRYEGRRWAQSVFFAIAALGALWGGAQLVVLGPIIASISFIVVAGSLMSGWFLRQP